jgi:hypothetical protein
MTLDLYTNLVKKNVLKVTETYAIFSFISNGKVRNFAWGDNIPDFVTHICRSGALHRTLWHIIFTNLDKAVRVINCTLFCKPVAVKAVTDIRLGVSSVSTLVQKVPRLAELWKCYPVD